MGQRLRLLVEASAAVATTIERGVSADALCQLLVPAFADLCLVALVEDPAARRATDGLALRLAGEAWALPVGEERADTLTWIVARMRWLCREEGQRRYPQECTPPPESSLDAWLLVPLVAGGEVLGALGFGRMGDAPFDEHDRLWAEVLGGRVAAAALNRGLVSEAQEAVRLRDDFISIASHELKTPLTALLLQLVSTQRAADNAGPEAARFGERVARLGRSASRLARLVDRLLDISRISAGRLDLELRDVDLCGLVRAVVHEHDDELLRSGCDAHVEAGPPLWGRWDGTRVEQVVTNLLSNAMKYGRGRPIVLGVARAGRFAVIRVRDRGPGITGPDRERIFQRFERLRGAEVASGLGLGLWIARQIVEAHGGRIRVADAEGPGAELVVELPLAPQESGAR